MTPRDALQPLFAEYEPADMARRVGKGDKAANLSRFIDAGRAIDAAVAAPDPAPLHGDHPADSYTYEGCHGCHPAAPTMTERERAAIDKLYPYGEAPLTFDDEGTVMPHWIDTRTGEIEEWTEYEERVFRERMRQRILIVAAVGAIALAVIIAIAVFG